MLNSAEQQRGRYNSRCRPESRRSWILRTWSPAPTVRPVRLHITLKQSCPCVTPSPETMLIPSAWAASGRNSTGGGGSLCCGSCATYTHCKIRASNIVLARVPARFPPFTCSSSPELYDCRSLNTDCLGAGRWPTVSEAGSSGYSSCCGHRHCSQACCGCGCCCWWCWHCWWYDCGREARLSYPKPPTIPAVGG